MITLTMPGCVVWSGDEYNLLVAGRHGFHLPVKRSAGRPNQHDAVLRFDGLQGFRKLLLQSLGVRLTRKAANVLKAFTKQHS